MVTEVVIPPKKNQRAQRSYGKGLCELCCIPLLRTGVTTYEAIYAIRQSGNPVMLVDSSGLEVYMIGGNIAVAAGLLIGLGQAFVWDDKGNFGIVGWRRVKVLK